MPRRGAATPSLRREGERGTGSAWAWAWAREAVCYGTSPEGIPGNDDAGTLSAWYVFSAMGFYPVAGADLYVVGSPLFPRVEVQLAGGLLVIEAPAASRDNVYVQSLTLNGQPVTVPWFRHADIAAGGTLHFELGAKPSTWGVVAAGTPFGQR